MLGYSEILQILIEKLVQYVKKIRIIQFIIVFQEINYRAIWD